MINDFYMSLNASMNNPKNLLKKQQSCRSFKGKISINKLCLPGKKSSINSRNDNHSGLSTRRINQKIIHFSKSQVKSSSVSYLPKIKDKSFSLASPHYDNEMMHEKRKRCLEFAGKIKLKKYIRNRIFKKGAPIEEIKDTSSEIKRMFIDDKMEFFKTHLEIKQDPKNQGTTASQKHTIQVNGGKVNLEDLAYGAKIYYRARLVEKNGLVYYEFDTEIGDEDDELANNESKLKKDNKIMELIKNYRKKELNNLKLGKLGRTTKMKIKSDVTKDKNIYRNLFHVLLPSLKRQCKLS